MKKTELVGVIAALLLVAGVIGFGFYQYWQIKHQPKDAATEQQAKQKAADEEAKKLTEEVGKLVVLPAGEQATVGTVSDIEKLKGQLFFKDAKNGDKVLMFPVAKLAVLYSPELKKVVNIGPLNTDLLASSAAQNPSPQPQAKIILRNGTKITGLASAAETELQKAFPGADIQKKEQASRNTYQETVVVALNSNAQNAAKVLADFYKVKVSAELPEGEEKPEGMDIVVILGGDRKE